MTDTAVEVGLSYERFRKVWREMCADQAFPAPFHGRVWDREAVAAWKMMRSAQRLVAELPPRAAAVPDPGARAQRARSALQQLRAS